MTFPIWIPAALLAALFLAWRMAMQQRIRAEMSVNAAALSRFFFGWPIACMMLAGYMLATGRTALPTLDASFWWFAWLAGFAQMLATNLIIMSFGFRNLVSGTAYMKTETLIVAFLGWFILGEALAPLAWMGIGIAFAGILFVSVEGGARGLIQWLRGLKQPAALTGLSAGLLFALTAIFIKQSANEIADVERTYAGLIVLTAVLGFQALMQGLYVIIREPDQFRAMLVRWRITAQVGILAAIASAGWFIAYAHAPVALVGILGQTQILYTLGFGRFYLNEPLSQSELTGILLVGTGVIMALASSL
ncbi:MAG: DMT family transporter [Parasphingorhabdus sp.]|uniref:DMT family transporter n=1 Tax=Parasphingorhabdus sp. TaxID=2709688 RepID=UPI0032664F26